ncbi:MAG: biotin--[acetyl-CoA-carboxylase] ligase [Candidatus Schekmanbacteria bacterium]|nr:biotin--[acetyl-CoA-carboxylase] ligase [Candidatus Schekmanbacteria bacterium]
MDIQYIKERIALNPFASSFHHFASIDSTNNKAKELAESGFPDCTVVIADSQTSGRGRMKRQWYSPKGEGIYISLILRPSLPSSKYYFFTMLPCISAVEAISECTGLKCGVKWPNDIFIAGKKTGGILTEASLKYDKIDFIICGIGINVNIEHFEGQFLHPPTSLFLETKEKTAIEALIASFINSFYNHYKLLLSKNGEDEVRSIYRTYSLCLGKKVRLIDGEKIIEGKAVDIDEQGYLLVKCQDENILKFSTGDLFILD